MNAETKARLQKVIERAMQALEKLEAALDANDNIKIGAALWQLRRELKTAERMGNDDPETSRQ